MKRTVALVSYNSSGEEETEAQNPVKKRKLPRLASSLVVATPKDNPALHQGRIRTTPHVEGQWASHVYVSIKVEKLSAMYKLILDALQTARKLEPALHDLFTEPDKYFDLHLSLSRPVFLRTHQRDDLKQVVRQLAQKSSSFKVSFTTFSVLTNDERTRTFLALDVGSGHRELEHLSDGLSPFLSNLRQKEYYADPQFHASIAWALLTQPTDAQADTFQAVPQLSDSLPVTLNEQYARMLSSTSCGAFDVDALCVKIGKDVFSWRCAA